MMIIHLKTLQSLELADNLLGEGVEFVVDATMEHPQMRYLGLRGMTTNHIVFQKIGNKLTDKEVELVVALLTKNHVLKRINLSDNCIDDTVILKTLPC